jgi:hypothetical protein
MLAEYNKRMAMIYSFRQAAADIGYSFGTEYPARADALVTCEMNFIRYKKKVGYVPGYRIGASYTKAPKKRKMATTPCPGSKKKAKTDMDDDESEPDPTSPKKRAKGKVMKENKSDPPSPEAEPQTPGDIKDDTFKPEDDDEIDENWLGVTAWGLID